MASTRLAPAGARRQVAQALAAFAARRVPCRWWVMPSSAPPDLVSHLLANGMRLHYEAPAMAADLSRASCRVLERPPDLEIERVRDLATLETWAATLMPLVELDLSKLPDGVPRIAGSEVKWETGSAVYRKTKSAPAKDLDEEMTAQIQKTAVGVYQALKLRDYGRVDLRLTDAGEIYVIEANPNPWIASGAEFAMAARESGRSYTQLIGEIVELARQRA